MNARRIGLGLRLLGPIVEIVCIAVLLSGSARGRAAFGLDLEPLPYIGLAIGLAMVAFGLGLSIPRTSLRRRSGGGSSPGDRIRDPD